MREKPKRKERLGPHRLGDAGSAKKTTAPAGGGCSLSGDFEKRTAAESVERI